MINSTHKHYQESGAINLPGLFISLALLIISSVIIGYLYAIVTYINPLVYINLMLTIGAGIGMGLAARVAVRISKNRNKKSQYIIAITAGLMVSYCQWICYLMTILHDEQPSPGVYLTEFIQLSFFGGLFSLMADINQYGLWQMFNVTFKGTALTLIWALETGILILIPITAIFRKKIYPFSEMNNMWYPKHTLRNEFESIASPIKTTQELEKDPVNALKSLTYGSSNRYSKIHIYFIEGEEKQYLTVEKIYIEDQGKGKENIDNIVNNFTISTSDARTILESFENKQETLDII